MEIDVSKEMLDWVALWLEESRTLAKELTHEAPMVFENESITLHHTSYEKESKKLSLQCISVKEKHLLEKWRLEIEIKNVNLKGVMELHRATREALAHWKMFLALDCYLLNPCQLCTQ